LLKNKLFKNKLTLNKWKKIIYKKKIKLIKIKKISEIYRSDSDFNISTIDCDVVVKNKKIKRIVQLEGDSVVIVPVLKLKNKKKLMTILVKQFRLAVGSETLEFPSGSVNNNLYKNQALKEIFEETGLKIKKNNLIKLNNKPIFMLPSNNFARVNFYYFIKKIDLNWIKRNNNKKTGIKNEGELITTKIVTFDSLKFIQSASVIVGLSLLNNNKILK
jgi:hypothetical protein